MCVTFGFDLVLQATETAIMNNGGGTYMWSYCWCFGSMLSFAVADLCFCVNYFLGSMKSYLVPVILTFFSLYIRINYRVMCKCISFYFKFYMLYLKQQNEQKWWGHSDNNNSTSHVNYTFDPQLNCYLFIKPVPGLIHSNNKIVKIYLL